MNRRGFFGSMFKGAAAVAVAPAAKALAESVKDPEPVSIVTPDGVPSVFTFPSWSGHCSYKDSAGHMYHYYTTEASTAMFVSERQYPVVTFASRTSTSCV